jgi:penicillin-binding protein 2
VRISEHPGNVRVIQEGMEMTTAGSGTAARVFRGAPYRSAGKTGTAQVVNRAAAAVDPRSLPLWKRHRALYIGYAPADNPTIAVAVAVEGGGFGADTAAPIVRKVFEAWLFGTRPALPKSADARAPAARPDFSGVLSSVRSTAGAVPMAPATPAMQEKTTP